MSSLREMDLRSVDNLVDFVRGPGYVLDFSDRTYSQFFATEIAADIDDPIYSTGGGSKGKRLRTFLSIADDATAARTIRALWEYRVAHLEQTEQKDPVANAQGKYAALLSKLGGTNAPTPPPPPAASDQEKVAALKAEILRLTGLPAQQRGYAFEQFLVRLFDLYGMKPREPFRNRGEQIDGSFVLDGETYLFEAKWQGEQIAAKDLRDFEGKLSEKAFWARGLFVSHSGFREDGLYSFGRGKRTICMSGLDLFEMLDRGLPLNEVIQRKVRRAAENGRPHTPVADLFWPYGPYGPCGLSAAPQSGDLAVHIESLKLWNFRSFASSNPDLEGFVGPQPFDVPLEAETSVFIGRNGAGKSALIQALLRLFGETRDERSVQPSDFFVPPTERLESQPLRRLFIEAVLCFPELSVEGADADQTVLPVFRHMVVEGEGARPYVRMRLEASWQLAGTLDGIVEESLFWILGADDVPFGDGDPLIKKKVSVSERSHVLVRYIPASRDITALTRLTVRSLGRSLMKAIKWEKKEQIDALIRQASSELDEEGALKRVNSAINACWSQLNTAETGTVARLSVLAPDLQQIVRSATIMLNPSATGRLMAVEELSDGQRSLFHFALVKALLDLRLELEGEVASGKSPAFQPEFARAPALTIFAFD